MPRYHTSIWKLSPMLEPTSEDPFPERHPAFDGKWHWYDGAFPHHQPLPYLGNIYNYLVGLGQTPVELIRIGDKYHIVSKDAD